MGLPLMAVPEEQEGVGGTLADLLALLRVAGEHAVPVPLAETALANLLVARRGWRSLRAARRRWRWGVVAPGWTRLTGKVDARAVRGCRRALRVGRRRREASRRWWSMPAQRRSRSRIRRAMPASRTAR
jgi:hypothetical protein